MCARSWSRLFGTLVLVCAAAPLSAQTDGPRPPVLFVTSLQGPSGGTGSGQVQPRPGDMASMPATVLDDRQPGANLDGPRQISLTVSRPMPVGDLLLLLVNGTPLSLVTDDEVSGNFTGDLKGLTMRQALEAVLFPRDLDYAVQGTLVRVFPRKAATRLFNVNYLNVHRSLQRAAANLSSSSETDLFDEIEKGVQSLLSSSGRMHVDRTAGLVQVTDFADRLDQIGVYVEAVELRATRQVRIDAQVFEVAFPDGGPSSIDWRAAAGGRRSVSRAATGHPPAGLAVTDIDGLKKIIAQQGSLTTIATPQVLAMNNEPAVMRIGSEAVYFESATASNGDRRTTSLPTVLEGLTLTVVPQISADGIVQLHVSPAYTSLRAQSKSPSGSVVPVLSVNEADTIVRVQDGETVVLAGFLSEREKAKPTTGFATVKSELVILLTPTIVSPGSPH